MKKLFIVALLSLVLFSCKNNAEKDQTAENTEAAEKNVKIQQKIANANGIKSFKDVEEIDFTFNVKVNDSLKSSRSWQWKPKTHEVKLTEEDSTSSYIRKGDNALSEDEKKMDQKFVNDSYWLLFPYQMVWSEASFEQQKNVKAPISGDQMNKVTVSYSKQGGYTPGDTYEVFYDDDYMIREWIYKASGGNKQMTTTWEDYSDYKGLKIAKDHKSPDGSFELYFTDVEVK